MLFNLLLLEFCSGRIADMKSLKANVDVLHTYKKNITYFLKITSEKCPRPSKHAHLRSSNFNGLGWPASRARPISNSAERSERSPPIRTWTADRLANANAYAFSEPLRSACARASLYSSKAFLSRALLKAALPSSLSLLFKKIY